MIMIEVVRSILGFSVAFGFLRKCLSRCVHWSSPRTSSQQWLEDFIVRSFGVLEAPIHPRLLWLAFSVIQFLRRFIAIYKIFKTINKQPYLAFYELDCLKYAYLAFITFCCHVSDYLRDTRTY